jgi:hypothetical protein
MRAVMRIGRRRSRKLRTHHGEHRSIAGHRAKLRLGNLLHGVDQHRQPQFAAVLGSPWLNSLAHRLCLACPITPPNTNPVVINPFREPWLKENPPDVICFTQVRGRPALNLRNGPETLPNPVRSPGRPRHRLRPDLVRRRIGPDCADLSHSDLISVEIAARSVLGWCAPATNGSACAKIFLRFFIADGACGGLACENPSSANASTLPDSHIDCVNRA